MVENRSWWFAQEQRFLAQAGDAVRVTVFPEGDTFEVAAIENQATGQAVVLRDETGRPMWAGRGRGQ